MARMLVVLVGIGLAVTGFLFAGPLYTGSLFWLLPPKTRPTRHPPVLDYWQPVHKGGVDIGTGLYTRNDDDLIVDDATPLVVRRTYLSGDHVSREFGVGGTHSGELYLIGDGRTFQWVELILADGARIHFDRTTAGTSIANALFQHVSTPTRFFGAQVGWVGFEWVLRLADGSLATFKACTPTGHDKCAVIQTRDWDGHRTRYARDQSGRLLRVEGTSHTIVFDYDAQGRVVRVFEPGGKIVSYEYDAGGRLVRVVTSDGTTRRYGYDDHDAMIGIDEPRWSIRNTFDADGRLAKQVTHLATDPEPVTFTFAYHVDKGAVTQTDMTEDGVHTRYTFNSSHYLMSETLDADGSNPALVTFDRDAVTNIASALNVQCNSHDGHIVRTMNATPGFEEETAEAFVEQNCH